MDNDGMKESLSKTGGWIYKKLSTLRTSVYIIALLLPFYVLGTIFPQGVAIELYEGTGGKFLWAVRLFDLLSIFQSPWFLVPAFLLCANLIVCAYDRFFILMSRRSPLPDTFRPDHVIPLNAYAEGAEGAVDRVLKEKLGFRDVPSTGAGAGEGGPWKVKEKGLSYRWLTWLYHLGFVLCFLGFLLTGLFVVDGYMTLEVGEPAAIVSMEDEEEKLGWLRGKDHYVPDFQLVLDEFITEYTERPRLDYPKDKLSRLAVALGWKSPSFTLKDESLFPKDWKSALRVVRGDETVYEKTIEVNDPLRFEGYTFYQAAFEQTLKIGVDKNLIFLDAVTNEDIELPGIEGTFRFGTLRNGTLSRLDGTVETLKPFVIVKRTIKGGDEELKEELGKLSLGSSIKVGGRRVRFASASEASILSYRYDPGVPILWAAGVLVFSVMSLRCFGRWYMLAYRVEETAGENKLLLSISARGLSADPEKLVKRITHYLAGPGS